MSDMLKAIAAIAAGCLISGWSLGSWSVAIGLLGVLTMLGGIIWCIYSFVESTYE